MHLNPPGVSKYGRIHSDNCSSVEGRCCEMNLRDEMKCEVRWKKGVSLQVIDAGCLVIVMGKQTCRFIGAVPWLRWLVSGFSPRRPVFNPGTSPCAVFLVGIVALAQVFLIPPMLHIHLHLRIHTGEAWEPADKKFSFVSRGVLDGKPLFIFFFSLRR